MALSKGDMRGSTTCMPANRRRLFAHRGRRGSRSGTARWIRLLGAAAIAFCAACGSGQDAGSSSSATTQSEHLYVSQAGSNTVAVVDAGRGVVLLRLEVGLLPHGFAASADGRTLYVAVVGSQAVAEIDTEAARVRRTFLTAPVPRQRADGSVIQPHVDQDGFSHSTCYDCHRADGAQPKYVGDRPFGLLLSPDGTRLLVSHLRSGVLSEIDLNSGRIARQLALQPAGAASEPVALARLGDEVWVALRPSQPSTQPGALRRLDAASWAQLAADVATGADPSALLALPGRERVLVSNFDTNTVTEMGRTAAPRSHVVSPGPLGLVDLGGTNVLAIDYYSNAVSFIDLDRGATETLPLVHDGVPYANPTHGALAGNGSSVWLVASGTDGHLLQLDLTTRQVVRDVPIDGLSFGIARVSVTTPR